MTQASSLILWLAPVRGITDVVYRQAVACCFGGFDRAVAPFIPLRQGQALRPAELRQVAPENNRNLRVIPQLLTHHAPSLAAAMLVLAEQGHTEVNWNLGCPYPTVAGRGRGAGLLPHPDRIDAILGQVLRNTAIRLSVKLRLGYREADEFQAVFKVLNRYPLSEVILHPRTAVQMYGGSVDLKRAAQAAAMCQHPFVYNGDITSVSGFSARRAYFPAAAGWMLGRGALVCPFLPGRIKGLPLPTAELQRRQLRQFHDCLLAGYREWLSGPGHLLSKMREHWVHLSQGFAAPRQVLALIRQGTDLAAYSSAVERAFALPLEPRVERDTG